MCNIGAIGLGLSAGGMVSNFIASKQEANAYANYQIKQSQAAVDNFIQQTQALNTRYAQEEEAIANQKQEIYIQNLQRQATAQASAASSGITGLSIEGLFKGYDRATAVSNYTAARNLQMKGLQYSNELDGLRVQAINAINLQQQYTSNSSSNLVGGIGGLLTDYSKTQKSNAQFNFWTKNSSSRFTPIIMSTSAYSGGLA